MELMACCLTLSLSLYWSQVLSLGSRQTARDGVGSRIGLRVGSLAWLFARALGLLGRGLLGGGLAGPLGSLASLVLVRIALFWVIGSYHRRRGCCLPF
jgi:hypothetical protein